MHTGSVGFRGVAPKVDTEDLVGAAEVAELLGLSHPSSVSTYARRYRNFPKPVLLLPKSKVRLWRRSQILLWATSEDRATRARSDTGLSRRPSD
jgi:predicted DNA-binding transcriptional regulator AlpA